MTEEELCRECANDDFWRGYKEGRKEAADALEELVQALHHISLSSQNSMSSKEECGRIARAALGEKE